MPKIDYQLHDLPWVICEIAHNTTQDFMGGVIATQ